MKALVFSDPALTADRLPGRTFLAVCGHIHQCWGGEAGIGTTPVVNGGPDARFLEI